MVFLRMGEFMKYRITVKDLPVLSAKDKDTADAQLQGIIQSPYLWNNLIDIITGNLCVEEVEGGEETPR